MKRIIGEYTGKEKGVLLICFGGIHGNEMAGVVALERLFVALENEPIRNPDFLFKGKVIGIRGNLKALRQKKRFLRQDLNRIWSPKNINKVLQTPKNKLDFELEELRELLDTVHQAIADYQPERVVVLDLHTTTADGGFFILTTDDKRSEEIALGVNAPIVHGLMAGAHDTTLHYFNTKNLGVDTVTIILESGQHDDPASIDHAYSGIVNLLRSIGCVPKRHIEQRHDNLLLQNSKGLPKITKLIHYHRIHDGDGFQMLPGFKNFQPIKKGQLLAKDKHGEIYAPLDGLMLMPLYQPQGDDGYFLIEEVSQKQEVGLNY